MTIERTFPQGYWRVTAIVQDNYETRLYAGYTKAEASRFFRQEMREMYGRNWWRD